jgi:hypothetical protein
MVNSGMLQLIWIQILPIQIKSCKIAPIVPIDDPVNIQHRYNVEDEIFSQYFGFH